MALSPTLPSGWTLRGAIQQFIDVYVSRETFVEVERAFPYMVAREFASGGGDVRKCQQSQRHISHISYLRFPNLNGTSLKTRCLSMLQILEFLLHPLKVGVTGIYYLGLSFDIGRSAAWATVDSNSTPCLCSHTSHTAVNADATVNAEHQALFFGCGTTNGIATTTTCKRQTRPGPTRCPSIFLLWIQDSGFCGLPL